MTSGFKLGAYSDTPPAPFTVPDEGFYVLTLDDWDDPIRSNFEDKETGEYPYRANMKFKIVADVIDGDTTFADETVSAFFGLNLNPHVKDSIWHLLLALDPATEPEPGADVTAYRGKRVIGEIKHKVQPSKKYPGQTVTYANLGAIKPFKKPKKQAAPEAVPAQNPLLDEEEV